MKKTSLCLLFIICCLTAKAQNVPVFNGKQLVDVSTVPVWSFNDRPAGWYRIGSVTDVLRGNATFELRDNADHSTIRFEVGVSFNGIAGSAFTLTSHSFWATPTFKKVRLLTATTYDSFFLEVYVDPHNNNFQAFNAYLINPLGYSDWSLVNWTLGNIPPGYTATEFNTDRLFAVGNMGNGNILSVSRDGKVDVNGTLRAREVKVETASWPDYVFSDQYKLITLPETEKFIKANNRLPNIPSAKTIEQEGLSLGQINKLLMEKIEETTLHLIEMDKKLKALTLQVESQNKLLNRKK